MALVFDTSVAKAKPDDNRRPSGYCPFCDTEALENILAREGERIWLMNKFRTLRDTTQTVLIESSEHEGDIPTYAPEQWRDVLGFALRCWHVMSAAGEHTSVLLYKNAGPISGGSLRHPHMQIVGLAHEDGYTEVSATNLTGPAVHREDKVEVCVSDEPLMGFFEVNVAADAKVLALELGARARVCGEERGGAQATSGASGTKAAVGAPFAGGADGSAAGGSISTPTLDAFARCIQGTVRYLLEQHHGGTCTSYNLFFYPPSVQAGKVVCKVVPRWITSAYFIGYKIAQVNAPERMASDAAELRAYLA